MKLLVIFQAYNHIVSKTLQIELANDPIDILSFTPLFVHTNMVSLTDIYFHTIFSESEIKEFFFQKRRFIWFLFKLSTYSFL